MKKSLIALAALTAFTGVASAQSSVTLFGVLDVNARSTKTGSATVKSLSTDGNASSRLGFRGIEDLGGGMRAGFWLEGGMTPDDGTVAGQQWQRRSTVSLLGGFGEIRLGRDYSATFWNYTIFDPFGTNGVGSMLGVVSTLGNAGNGTPAVLPAGSSVGTLVRANNTVGYFLPALGGLYGQVQVAAGEGNTTGNKYIGGRIGYAAGPVNVAGAWGKTYKTGTMRDDYKDINFGASFNMGFMSIMSQYSKRDYSAASQKTFLLGTTVPMGAGTLKFSYVKSTSNGGTEDWLTAVGVRAGLATPPPVTVARVEATVAAALLPLRGAIDAKKFTAGYVHDLSKRTAVYVHLTKENRETSFFDVTAYEFGVRHSF